MLVLQTPPIFSDNMVLQRGKPIPVWGSGPDGKTVRVRFECGTHSAEAVTDVYRGDWSLMLPPLAAGLHGELIINNGETELRFRNVVTGDVWFAGGQSNMEMELINCRNGEAELAACANADIRFYQVVKRAVIDEDYLREEAQSAWQVCEPQTAAMLSAAAYFFARKINADVGVPIGIIGCSWGGTSIAAWMSREQLERSLAGRRCIDDYAAKIGGKSDAQYYAAMEEYDAQWRAWDDRVRARREKEPEVSWETLNKECGPCPWPQPAGNPSPFRPTNLYKSRIRRVVPFALKGFLYYQGEEDQERAADYDELMYYLIDQWRRDWGDNNLPFLFVQLPMYASREDVEAGLPSKNWCVLRESQYHASQKIAHTGMAVIIDCGEYENIHPLDKQTVGFRLALQALQKVYGRDVEADGPLCVWAQVEGGSLRLHFDHAQSGLEFRGEPAGFEIAAASGPYFPAHAVIDGNDVVIRSDKVSKPRSARYAWIQFGPTPLFAQNGLAAMPFRTNDGEPANR
jgi:sialate O-acetylesterase